MNTMNSIITMEDYLPRINNRKCLALDCEMVGIRDGDIHMLARVSLVDHQGHCVYDRYVKPQETVVDYRTAVSGIRPEDLVKGESFGVVTQDVRKLIHGCILVGHALHHDLQVLAIKHPKHMTRDTALYKPFRKIAGGNTPSLKLLAKELLNKTIQIGEHSSIEDAYTAMQIYMKYHEPWEKKLRGRKSR